MFNANVHTLFRIPNYELNVPINIFFGEEYLSCAERDNVVDFFPDEGICQRWIIEQDITDDKIFYIKSAAERYNYTQYLGAPNQNGQVFLYTSKNNYTKWSIERTSDDNYVITYKGDKFDRNLLEIVVAKYNEDVEWTLPYNDIVTIYNKGDECIFNLEHIINIPNYGREGGTYLYHIIRNYKNLKGKTIFTQGNPFEHNETFLFGVDNFDKTLDVQPLGLRWLKSHMIPPEDFIEEYKTVTDYGLVYLRTTIDSNLIIPEFRDEGINALNVTARTEYPSYNDVGLAIGFLHRAGFPYVKSLNSVQIPHTKPLDKIFFTYSGLFSVNRKNIAKHDITVYQDLLKELLSYNDQGSTNGYILERLWLYIFE